MHSVVQWNVPPLFPRPKFWIFKFKITRFVEVPILAIVLGEPGYAKRKQIWTLLFFRIVNLTYWWKRKCFLYAHTVEFFFIHPTCTSNPKFHRFVRDQATTLWGRLFLIPNAEEDDSRKKSADIPSPTFRFPLSGGFRGVLLDRWVWWSVRFLSWEISLRKLTSFGYQFEG